MSYVNKEVLAEMIEAKADTVIKGKEVFLYIKKWLDFIPTADVVEVVRCKDCKYLYCLSAVDRQFYCRHHPKGLNGINIVEDNPYCSYGERSEE